MSQPWPEPTSPAELTELLRRSQAPTNASVEGDEATGKPATPAQIDGDRQPPAPQPAPDSETHDVDSAMGSAGNGPLFSQADVSGSG